MLDFVFLFPLQDCHSFRCYYLDYSCRYVFCNSSRVSNKTNTGTLMYKLCVEWEIYLSIYKRQMSCEQGFPMVTPQKGLLPDSLSCTQQHNSVPEQTISRGHHSLTKHFSLNHLNKPKKARFSHIRTSSN